MRECNFTSTGKERVSEDIFSINSREILHNRGLLLARQSGVACALGSIIRRIIFDPVGGYFSASTNLWKPWNRFLLYVLYLDMVR